MTKQERDTLEKIIKKKTDEILKTFDSWAMKKVECEMCVHFDEPNCLCKLYNKEVPAHIIDKGCDKWQPDDIPF